MKIRSLIFWLVNVAAILVLNALALTWVNVSINGLVLFILVNSLISSREFKYFQALLISFFLIFSYLATGLLLDYFGNYQTVLPDGEEIPFDFLIFSSVILLFLGILASAIIILVSQMIMRRKLKLEEKTNLIEELGNDSFT